MAFISGSREEEPDHLAVLFIALLSARLEAASANLGDILVIENTIVVNLATTGLACNAYDENIQDLILQMLQDRYRIVLQLHCGSQDILSNTL